MIIGPSGAGKGTLIKRALEDFKELDKTISHTTRKIRLNEKAIKFIEEKIGEMIDWRGAIEFALFEYEKKDKRELTNG